MVAERTRSQLERGRPAAIARTGLDAADSARLLALQNLSGADAAINCWNDKYHFDFWRPWNAIPRGDEDLRADTDPDATWTALLTAPYPEWTSGHNCLDGAHTAVLRMFFGDDPVEGRSRSRARS